MKLKQLLEEMVKGVVDNPEAVRIRETAGERNVILEIIVDSKDVGKVIGRKGRTIDAMRTVLIASAGKVGKKVRIEVIEKGE